MRRPSCSSGTAPALGAIAVRGFFLNTSGRRWPLAALAVKLTTLSSVEDCWRPVGFQSGSRFLRRRLLARKSLDSWERMSAAEAARSTVAKRICCP